MSGDASIARDVATWDRDMDRAGLCWVGEDLVETGGGRMAERGAGAAGKHSRQLSRAQ